MRYLFLILFTSAFSLIADEKPTPKITPELRAKFWRASAEFNAAQSKLQQAKSSLDSAVMDLRAVCKDQELTIDQAGEPTCRDKEPEKK